MEYGRLRYYGNEPHRYQHTIGVCAEVKGLLWKLFAGSASQRVCVLPRVYDDEHAVLQSCALHQQNYT